MIKDLPLCVYPIHHSNKHTYSISVCSLTGFPSYRQVIPLSCTIRCYIGWSGNPDQSCIKGGKEASGISVTTDLHCLHKLSAIENKMMLEHKTVAVGHYTCWPTSIQDQPIVLEEDGLWKSGVLWSKEKYYYPRGAWNNRIDEELD